MSTTTLSRSLMVGGALVAAAAAGQYLFSSSNKSGSSTGDDPEIVVLADVDDDDDDEDYITEQDVVKIFDQLFLEMQAVLAKLSQQVHQLQMSGQMIPEKQLRMLLKGEFERALGIKQAEIFASFDIEEECLEEAVWEFLDKDNNANVKKAVERFQRLWENVSGESVVGKRKGGGGGGDQAVVAEEEVLLPPPKLVEAAEIYFTALTDAMEEIVNEFKSQGKSLQDPSVAQQLQMQFASVANEKGEQALSDKAGVTLNQFQKSIEANAQDPSVGRALAMLQMKQQQALMQMGIPTM